MKNNIKTHYEIQSHASKCYKHSYMLMSGTKDFLLKVSEYNTNDPNRNDASAIVWDKIRHILNPKLTPSLENRRDYAVDFEHRLHFFPMRFPKTRWRTIQVLILCMQIPHSGVSCQIAFAHMGGFGGLQEIGRWFHY